MASSPFHIRALAGGEAAACEAILRRLPEWFGIEESLVEYVRDVERFETWVTDLDGRVIGFVTLKTHNPHSAEVQVIAVDPVHHGGGVGTALVDKVESVCAERGVAFLQVKTVGPSSACEHYARTRAFYGRCGFLPLEENQLWGADNPCLIQVKSIA